MQNRLLAPQWASRNLDLTQWGITQEQNEILKNGPVDEVYWKIWKKVLSNAKTKVNGKLYGLFECREKGVLIVPEGFDPESRAF